jgi:S1-C subfamily serine protease
MLTGGLAPAVLFGLVLATPAPFDSPADPNAKGYLGVSIRTDSQTNAITVVDVVADGPSDRAGLRVGDVVLKVGSYEPKGTDDLIREVAGHRPGQYVVLSVVRENEKHAVKIKLGRRPDDLPPVGGVAPGVPRKEKEPSPPK